MQGFLAQETGYSTYYLMRFSFGTYGARIISLFVALSFMGWAGIGIGLAVETISLLLNINYILLVCLLIGLFSVT